MTVDLSVAPGMVESTLRRQIVDYTGPSAYPAGGDPVVPAEVRMGKVFAVLGTISDGSAVRVGWYDAAAGTIVWFVPNTGAEAAGDLSTFSGRLEFIGQ